MTKVLGLEYQDIEQRKTFLKDNCQSVESASYMKPFSPDELAEFKNRLSEVAIKLDEFENEKKAFAEMMKHKMKPYLEEKAELLTNIKQKAEYVTEACYVFLNEEDRLIETYNAEGICISERPAMQKELQKTIYSLTGTNN